MATMKQIFGNMKKGLSTGNFTLNGLVQTLQHYCEDLENSTGGGGGGSEVSYTQTLQSGSECGTITIDGVGTKIYAPTPSAPTDVEVTQVLTTGTKIATITVDDVPTDIYAPASEGGEYVDVTADGSKSENALLNELYALIDSTKVTRNAKLVIAPSNPAQGTKIYALCSIDSAFYAFGWNDSGYTEGIRIRASSSEHYRYTWTSTSDNVGSNAPASGSKIILYYS